MVSAQKKCAWSGVEFCRFVGAVAFALGASCLPLRAAPAAPAPAGLPPAHDFPTYQPTGVATRIEATEAPNIDGDPSEAVWTKAKVIDEFYQVDPMPANSPTSAQSRVFSTTKTRCMCRSTLTTQNPTKLLRQCVRATAMSMSMTVCASTSIQGRRGAMPIISK
jgi:hypothetical protein